MDHTWNACATSRGTPRISGSQLLALAFGSDADPSRGCRARIAVRLAVAAAHGHVDFGAHLRALGAMTWRIGFTAFRARLVATKHVLGTLRHSAGTADRAGRRCRAALISVRWWGWRLIRWSRIGAASGNEQDEPKLGHGATLTRNARFMFVAAF